MLEDIRSTPLYFQLSESEKNSFFLKNFQAEIETQTQRTDMRTELGKGNELGE